jgi:cytochrome c-type biogenesis protein CcmH
MKRMLPIPAQQNCQKFFASFFQKRRAFFLRAAILCAALPTAAAPPHGHSAAEFERMAADLKSQLARQPENVDNWILLGRTSAALQHWPDAKDAFDHAIALRPDARALHAQLGEVLTLAADGSVTPAAGAEFGKAPDDPRSIFYLAVATAQRGDTQEAVRQLRALAAQAPPGADWRQLVLDEVQALEPGAPAEAAMPPAVADEVAAELARLGPAPDARPKHAAQGAPNGADVRSITALEAAVRQTPDAPQAWLGLARAYQAAGDAPHALDALHRANQSIRGNVDLLLAYADALAAGIQGGILPTDFVSIMQQVNAIDPDQRDALWYLGLAAVQRGDKYRAAGLWRRLVEALPAGSRERKTLQERLDALQ